MTYKAKLRRRAVKSSSTKVLGKWTPYQMILGPIYTEKSVKMSEEANVYQFKVQKDANKIDIKEAVEYIYGVDVASVNTMRVSHKGRAMRKTVRMPYKKAIVTLAGDKKIELLG